MDVKRFWEPFVGGVSITFDDGMDCQLEKAIPIMDGADIRGTFYLVPRDDDWQERLRPWVEVARAGHEIGNHTLSHPGSVNLPRIDHGLEDMALEEIEADILAAEERLVHIAPHQEQWTFCYPTYQTHVGRGESRRSYVPVVGRHFLAGRSVGEYGCANRPDRADLACVWGLPTERMSGFEMIGLVEELTAQGRWVVLIFHEIDGARLTVGSHEFGMLVNYLGRRSGDILTAPVVEVARKIADFRQADAASGTA